MDRQAKSSYNRPMNNSLSQKQQTVINANH
jgi:hypothetical protein